MANRTMNVKLALVSKTTAEWAAETTVIMKGMPVVETLADGTAKMKIGDGVNTFADLKYVEGGTAFELTKDGIIAALEFTPADAAKIGVAGGIASLDENGYIPSTQIPDAVDEIIEVTTIDDAPATGTSGKIYVALDTGLCYRWSGTTYTEISKSITVTASDTNGCIKVNGQDIVVYTAPAAITIDDALSDTSENPVQNKVVTEALSNKVDAGDTLELNCSL